MELNCRSVEVCASYRRVPGKHLLPSAFLGCDESSIQPGRLVIRSFTSRRWPAIVQQTVGSGSHTNTHKRTTMNEISVLIFKKREFL